MNSSDILLYLLKSTILSGIFYAYYALFLKDTIYHGYNRFYLIAALFFSLLIPFFRLSYFQLEEQDAVTAIQVIQFLNPNDLPQETGFLWDWKSISLLLLSITSLFFFVYLAQSVFRIYRLKWKYPVTKMGQIDFIETDVEEAPFSFLNNLFWKKSIDFQEDAGAKIFQHELTHIQEKHSWDRLFTQSLCSIFWMNPFHWLIQKELQNIHEFIADRAALGQGDVDSFAKMLLQTHYGNHFLNPSHSFYYSSIKRRIIMLTTSQSPKYAYLRKVAVLPMLAITLVLFSLHVKAQEKKATKPSGVEYKINMRPDSTTFSDPLTGKKVFSVATKDMPPPPPPSPPRVPTPPSAKKAKTTAENQVFRIKNGNFNDVKVALLDTTKVIIKRTKNGDELTLNAKKLNGTANSNSEIKLVKATGFPKTSPLIVIDGVISKGDLNDIFPQDIESVHVLKGENALAKYPENGANGVVEITTKKK
jgi:TonB-dependent SusC/RagA subfamily outer membrane receptor